jgi:uncharacterized membrane protein
MRSGFHNSGVNMSSLDRSASVLGGMALAVFGSRMESRMGYVAAFLGGELLRRGFTGHCYLYDILGQSSNPDHTRQLLGSSGGILVDESIVVNKPVDDVYGFWRNVENLPKVMRHLIEVENIGSTRSHWIAAGPAGTTVEWDAEIINERPNQLIGWKSVGSHNDIYSAGTVRFRKKPGNRTEVRIRMQYQPVAGKLGGLVGSLFSEEPGQEIRDDLARLRRSIEAVAELTSVTSRESAPYSPVTGRSF